MSFKTGNKFKAMAQDALAMSRLHAGREKLTTSDIVGNPLTVDEFDIAVMDTGETFAVFTFVEHPDHYYNAGILATKMVTAWANAYNGDVEVANDAYKKEKDKVVLQFKEEKTKSGTNNITTIELL